ncbi:prepilin peptidase [Haliangium sp.]|uniref:prepilin peptidase n=1 Tax=Haliangium sp. TaxID=2663208 RepID=UPI003D0C04B1
MSSLDAALEPLAATPFAHVFAGVLGLLWGSFANVCIYRMPPSDEHPDGLSVVRPGSHCPACGHAVRWYDNVPLLGFLFLRGRCRDCGVVISPRYLLVEAALGLLFVAAYHHAVVLAFAYEPLSVRMLRFLVLAAFQVVLVVIAFIDLDHKLILNKITYPAIPLFYGVGLLLPGQDWHVGLIGAALGYGLVRVIADGYRLLTGREGMGYGDGKLLAVVGALLGWQGVVAALFVGSLLGSVIGTAALVAGRRRARADEPAEAARDPEQADEPGEPEAEQVPLRHVEIPFGPFLVMGAIAYLYAQPWLRIDLALPGGM